MPCTIMMLTVAKGDENELHIYKGHKNYSVYFCSATPVVHVIHALGAHTVTHIFKFDGITYSELEHVQL